MALPSGQDLALVLVMAGVVISILEALAPGAHFVVLGVALLAAGLVALLLPPLATPVALAALVLVTGGAALWAYRNLDLYGGKGSGRTRDSASLAGQTGRVVERVTPTRGRVRLDDGGFDPFYSARSMDGEIPEGAEVIVLDPGGGSVLTVTAVDDRDDIDRALDRERARREARSQEAPRDDERAGGPRASERADAEGESESDRG
jgi:membrane protein implicated in regulation of membrane protease activity